MEENTQHAPAPKGDGANGGGANGGAATGPVGLDVGTSRVVVADGTPGRETRSQLNAFVAVPPSDMAENVLRQGGKSYERNCQSLYVYGDDSEFFAAILDAGARRPMCDGLLNPREELGRQMIERIIGLLVPRAKGDDVLCFSVPGEGVGAGGSLVYHEAVLRDFLRSLGYQAQAVNEGQAVVFSELQEENFTGVGVSFGGGMCNVAVSFMSVPLLSFSVPKGGDYIDRSVAEVFGEVNPTRVRLFKEENLDLSRPPRDEMTRALHIFYDDVIGTLVERLRAEFKRPGRLPRIDRPLPVVLAGGTARPAGFLQKFEGVLRGADFPVEIADVRMARDPLTATANGCYVAALSESK